MTLMIAVQLLSEILESSGSLQLNYEVEMKVDSAMLSMEKTQEARGGRVQ